MRQAINEGVAQASGEWIMKCDAHCVFDQGFDVKILANIEKNWVVIPRRYKLDVKKWEVMDEPPVDYMRVLVTDEKLSGVEWRRAGRPMVDTTMVFQGSCWFMSKEHFNNIGGLQTEGFGTFTQEPIEIAFNTWLSGGKVMVNKNTWYAHKHRKFGRTYAGLTHSQEVKDGNAYSRAKYIDRIQEIEKLCS